MKKKRKQSVAKLPNNKNNVIAIKTGGLHKSGQLGIYNRHYPPATSRQLTITRILNKNESKRTLDDWWLLGEYQCLDGLINEDDHLINRGIEALIIGAEMSPPSVSCLMDLGWILTQKGMGQMALKYFDQALTICNDSRDIWSLRGWAALSSGHRAKAIESFEKACLLNGTSQSDHETLMALNNNEDLKQISKGLILNKISVDEITQPGVDQIEAAKMSIYVLKAMLEKEPSDLLVIYSLAYARYITGQYDRAEPLLNSIINQEQNNSDALTMLGLIANKRKDQQLAKEYYSRAIAANQTHVLANVNLASLLQDKGEYRIARIYLQNAISVADEKDPHLPMALDLYGNNIAALDEDYDLEIEYHNRAISMDNKKPNFHANLITALLSAGRIIDARRAFQTTKSLNLRLPNEDMLRSLFKLYNGDHHHPYHYMNTIDALFPLMGKKAMLPLIDLVWKYRRDIPIDELYSFYGSFGMLAASCTANELALEVWKEGIKLEDGSVFTVNVAAELSNLNRHSDALEAAGSMSMITPRSWTVLGNINMHAGLYKSAIEAYKEALLHDEKFLLPILNAFQCAKEGYLASELDPFIEVLEKDWLDNPLAQAVRAEALMLKGEYSLAIAIFKDVLYRDEIIITPEELWVTEDDISINLMPSIEFHYSYGLALLKCNLLQPLYELIQMVREWSQWNNGDWTIIFAELLCLTDESVKALEYLDAMAEQPPVCISKAIIYRNLEHSNECIDFIKKGLAYSDNERFNHPFGRPDSVLHALNAEELFKINELDKAEFSAKQAVITDPSCAMSRLIYAKILGATNRNEDKRIILEEGLSRSPGDPDLLSELVTFLAVEIDDVTAATITFNKYRSLLDRNNFTSISHKLGELVAVVKLAKIESAIDESNDIVSTLQWESGQPLIIREWLVAAKIARQKIPILKTAYILYLAKIAEFLLINDLFTKFRDDCIMSSFFRTDKHKDICVYIEGGNAPSLGAMYRLFNEIDKSYRSSEEPIVTKFRDFISSGKTGSSQILRDRKFIDQLGELARLRNSVAHIDESNVDSLMGALSFVLNDDEPGLLFQAFIIKK